MAKKWSQAYSNGYKAGKQGKRFPKAKWNRYSTGFKQGYARGRAAKTSYKPRNNYRRRYY